MATRQYIGARYVPKFADPIEYNSALAYEALTIVSYLGNSYTSKKPVPVGVNPTNTEYWVLTGNYNGQVEALRQLAEDADVNATEAKEKVDELEAIVTMQRKFLLLADSYGMRETSQPTWTELWTASDSTARHKSVSSRGFTPAGNTFLMGITEFKNELTEAQRNEITDIVVAGGWNDAREITRGNTTESGVGEAIVGFCRYCEENFPNAKVWIGFIAWQMPYLTQNEASYANLRAVKNVYNRTYYNNLYRIPFCDIPMQYAVYNDATYFHPNALGSAQIYAALRNGTIGGEYTNHLGIALTTDDFTFPEGSNATIQTGAWRCTEKLVLMNLVIVNPLKGSDKAVATFKNGKFPCANLSTLFNLEVRGYPSGKSYYGYINNNRIMVEGTITAGDNLIITANFDSESA